MFHCLIEVEHQVAIKINWTIRFCRLILCIYFTFCVHMGYLSFIIMFSIIITVYYYKYLLMNVQSVILCNYRQQNTLSSDKNILIIHS